MTARFSINACRGSSMRSRWPAAMAITLGSSRTWLASSFWSSTTGDLLQ